VNNLKIAALKSAFILAAASDYVQSKKYTQLYLLKKFKYLKEPIFKKRLYCVIYCHEKN